MNVEQIVTGIQSVLKLAGARLSVQDSQGFAENLNLGQIIKGRVLRQYDQNRYLVQFSDQEKVVDSSVPLRTDEILYGRVVGLGEKVEIQRLRTEHAGAAGKPDVQEPVAPTGGFFNTSERLVNELFARYQVTIAPEQTDVIVRQGQKSGDVPGAAEAGLVLAKLGLTATPELLDAIMGALSAKNARPGTFSLPENMLMLKTGGTSGDAAAIPLTAVRSEVLAGMLDEALPRRPVKSGVDARDAVASAAVPDGDAAWEPSRQNGAAADDRQNPEVDLAKWLLNIQTDGAVAHRTATLPFWFDGRLVEIDLAVFDQKKNPKFADKIRHRQIVFTLDLEHLGRVVMNARVSGDHVGLQIATDDPRNTEMLASHLGELRGALKSSGWTVAEMTYAFTGGSGRSEVIASVVDHIVNQDSLNQLI